MTLLVAGGLALGACRGGSVRAPEEGSTSAGDSTEAGTADRPELDASAGSDAAPESTEARSAEPIVLDAEPIPVRIGLPYQPDVQFAPLYMAQAMGAFARSDAPALAPSFEYGNENDFLRLLAAGDMDAVVASGEQVILARGGGLPVTYVASWYQRFPVVVFGLDPALDEPAELPDLRVGLPMQAGASWIGWQALLAESGLELDAVETEVVGFEQLAAVQAGRVDAAVGYAANEPLRLRAAGQDVGVIEIADHFNLVSNGLVVSEQAIAERPEVVQALVSAFLAGLDSTLQDPDAAFEAALEAVPAAADEAVREAQRAVLQESLRFWDVPEEDLLGGMSADDWQASVDFLSEIGLLQAPVEVGTMIDGRFVEQAGIRR